MSIITKPERGQTNFWNFINENVFKSLWFLFSHYNPMGILNQKNLWPTLIYQFEHLGHPSLHQCLHTYNTRLLYVVLFRFRCMNDYIATLQNIFLHIMANCIVMYIMYNQKSRSDFLWYSIQSEPVSAVMLFRYFCWFKRTFQSAILQYDMNVEPEI